MQVHPPLTKLSRMANAPLNHAATDKRATSWAVGAATLLIMAASLAISVMTLSAKLEFWAPVDYSPIWLKIALWYQLAAGPAALLIIRKWRYLALGLAVAQIVMFAMLAV